MDKVTLENVSRRMITVELDHPSANKRAKEFRQRTVSRRTGKAGIRRLALEVPESIILRSGASCSGLPGWVAELPTVRRHVAARMLRIKREAG